MGRSHNQERHLPTFYQNYIYSHSPTPFVSKCFPIILKIRSLLTLSLKIRLFSISFLWAPGHIGIYGNERVGSLANSTANHSYLGSLWCPYTDLVTLQSTSHIHTGAIKAGIGFPTRVFAFGYSL